MTLGQYQRAVKALRNDAEYQAFIEEKWFRDVQTVARQKRFFHWELEFPEAFFDAHGFRPEEERGFDAVVGNPPYVSVTNIEPDLRAYILAKFDTAIGRFDLYITFAERALSLLREHSMFCFIQPVKFAIFANGKPFRELLLKQTQINCIVDVSQCDVFSDPTTYPCLPILQKRIPSPDHKLLVIRPPANSPELIGHPGSEAVSVVKIPQSRFHETPEHVICLRLSDELWKLIKHVAKVSFSLGDDFTIEQCIRIGSEAKRRKLVLDENRYSLAASQVKAACRRMLDGKDIERYSIAWEGYWLHYIPDELYNPKSPDVLETRKILIKRIASSLTAVPDLGLNESYFYPLNTIYALVAKRELDYSLYYITALLNSAFLDWYYKLLFEAIAIRGGYIEYREYLKYLPICRVTSTNSTNERARALDEGKSLYEHYLMKVDHNCILQFVKCQSHQTSNGNDIVHDLLSFLAEQMVDMSKQKQEEINGFLKWLERHIGASVDDLKNKTKLRSYHDCDFQTLLDVLRQNRRSLKVDADSRNVQETVEREFNASMSKLYPLKSKIAATDRLIDLVVYRLYGLTEQEIEIVEETMRY